ncbi:hypothetical protein LG204_14025 [Methylovorus menthalis]|uniref:GTP pyrophosphokinase n=1 Tax=Methylovorus menthalis TaxID=1002227 RepID=UPI001E3CD012|nr:hypothetical protein [Methylovorus menthalis]MCB4812431.1 hypothetical protein [Methylovorus menthalis]
MTTKNDIKSWYEVEKSSYENLKDYVIYTLERQIKTEGIDFLDIHGRVKSLESITDKISRKSYTHPRDQIKDICGVRVVTFIERDISKIANLIQSTFKVHVAHSINKTEDLGEDRFGYRSIHFVCDIGETREKLNECKNYVGKFFEIQIRTALQHAWAEIEHDRGYKISGKLPPHLKRSFNLIAGILELADKEFNTLVKEVENYSTSIVERTESGNLEIELNSPSITKFLELLLINYPQLKVDYSYTIDERDVTELNRFKIYNLQDLQNLLSNDFLEVISHERTTPMGFLRDAMMYKDMRRYFKDAWEQHWNGLDSKCYSRLCYKYGDRLVNGTLKEFQILRIDMDEEDF